MTRRIIFLTVISLILSVASPQTALSGVVIEQETKQEMPAGADPDDFIEGNYWALIIGINKYPTMDKDKQLETARKDAAAVAKLLKARYGFLDERMIELYDEAASRKGIVRAFSSLKRRMTDKDNLFIYYAGRGEYERAGKAKSEREIIKGGMGFWIPSDAELDDPSRYIFNSQIRDYVANIPARHIFLVVDSVFSHSLMARDDQRPAIHPAIKQISQLPSRWVLESGGLYPVPDIADKNKNGHSAFAWHLVKILSDNMKSYLLAKDIIEPLAIRVSNEVVGQYPYGSSLAGTGDEGGQFVFRLNKEFRREASQGASGGQDQSSQEEQVTKHLKKQQEEMGERKQAMLDRIKQAEEGGNRKTEEDENKRLIRAVVVGDTAAMEALIAKGADVNAKDEYGTTLLEEAIRTGHKDVAELLIAKGADVNAKNRIGMPLLHLAVSFENKAVAELLIAKGADVNAKGSDGETPLHWAANKDVAELLIAKGADVDAKDKFRKTPLRAAVRTGNKAVAELLIAKGADVNTKDRRGHTLLQAAIIYGNKDVVELLIAKGADVNAKDSFGETPLHWATNKDVVELLIAKGADVNAVNVDGKTPLQLKEERRLEEEKKRRQEAAAMKIEQEQKEREQKARAAAERQRMIEEARAYSRRPKIEIVIKDLTAKVLGRGYIIAGVPAEIIVRNEDSYTRGFTSSLFSDEMGVTMAGGYLAVGQGPHVYRVDAGRTLVLKFIPPHGEGNQSFSFWDDMHRSVKGEILVLELEGEGG